MSRAHLAVEPHGYHGGGIPLRWRTACGVVARTLNEPGAPSVEFTHDLVTCQRCRRSAAWAASRYNTERTP